MCMQPTTEFPVTRTKIQGMALVAAPATGVLKSDLFGATWLYMRKLYQKSNSLQTTWRTEIVRFEDGNKQKGMEDDVIGVTVIPVFIECSSPSHNVTQHTTSGCACILFNLRNVHAYGDYGI